MYRVIITAGISYLRNETEHMWFKYAYSSLEEAQDVCHTLNESAPDKDVYINHVPTSGDCLVLKPEAMRSPHDKFEIR